MHATTNQVPSPAQVSSPLVEMLTRLPALPRCSVEQRGCFSLLAPGLVFSAYGNALRGLVAGLRLELAARRAVPSRLPTLELGEAVLRGVGWRPGRGVGKVDGMATPLYLR